jgi:small subunit ribosomal protein S4e
MHLKRYSMPRYWGLGVKKEKFVAFPRGSHPKSMSIPLQVVLRDMLGLASSAREAKTILNQGKVLVDKKARKDRNFSVGLMDIVEMPEMKKSYRVEAGKRGLVLKETRVSDRKLCKIINKTVVKGGQEQLNLHDGKNILAGKKTRYKPGDSILISLPAQKILSHFPLKKGSKAVIVEGKNTGVSGTITAVSERKYMMEKATATLDAGGRKVETLKKYVFVTGLKEAGKGGRK